MALKDIISINVAGLNAQQRTVLQKAFFKRLGADLITAAGNPDVEGYVKPTYQDITKEMAEADIARIIKVWCRSIDDEVEITYTDMDA